jgi:hypothetical protein
MPSRTAVIAVGDPIIVRAPVPSWSVRVPKRAGELVIGDDVVVSEDMHWHVGHLQVDGLTRRVHAQPLNLAYPSELAAALADWVTVLVDASRFTTPRPCAQRFTPHDPQWRGWYRHAGGWDVACGCGWRVEDTVPGTKSAAIDAWTDHKAEVLSGLLARPSSGRGPLAHAVKIPGQHPHSPRYRLERVAPGGGDRRG